MAQNSWTQIASSPIARQNGVAFSIGSKGYIGLGAGSDNLIWEYDPSTNLYTQKASYPGSARQGDVYFVIGGKAYVGLGMPPSTTDFYEFDPVANTWIQKASFPGVARINAATFSLNGKGYLGTGESNGLVRNVDFWEYNPVTDVWTQKANYPGAGRTGAIGFATDGKGYIATGQTLFSQSVDMYQYNPLTNTWLQKANFPGAAKSHGAGFVCNGLIYIGTGLDYTGARKKDFWQYNPSNDSWVQKADFGGTARWLSSAFSIGNVGYMGTGDAGITVADMWKYNPDSLQASFKANGTICSGTTVPVYVIAGVDYGLSNVFSVQLSNASGIFTNPVVIGTISGTTGGLVNATIPFNTVAGAGYKVRVVSSNPVTVGADNAIPFSITASTIPTLAISTATTVVCASSQVNFNALTTNQGSAVFTWKVNGTPTGASSTSFAYTPQQGDIVNCTMAVSLACSTLDTVVSNNVAITVNPKVTPTIVINASTNTLCAGDSANLSAIVTNSGSAPLYQWKVNNITRASNTSTFKFTPSNLDFVTCTLTSSETCTNVNPVVSNQQIFNVIPQVSPSILINAATNPICTGDTFRVIASITNGGTSPILNWSLNNNQFSNGQTALAFVPVDGDVVNCTLLSNAQCATPNIVASNTITAHVSSMIGTPVITRNQDTLSTTAFLSYQWFFNGIAIPATDGGQNQHLAMHQAGNYYVVVSNGGCTSRSSVLISGNLHIGNQGGKEEIYVYPNPVTDIAYIHASKPLNVIVTDVAGRLVLMNRSANSIDMRGIPTGNYLLTLSDNSGSILKRLIIVK